MDVKRVALITGGMGGLGEAISVRLLADGFRVVVTYSPHNDHVSTWLESQWGQRRTIAAFPIDVDDFTNCQECVARVQEEIGNIDVLVNNAGITRDGTFRKMSFEDWRAVLTTDLDSMFNVTRPICDGMAERGWGRIVNISSVVGSRGAIGQANYAAAKSGIHGFTKSLALELARHGVTVNTVSPGFMDTKMVRAIPEEVLTQRIIPLIPAGRLGRPSEVAGLVSYLCSEEGAYVTGANFAVNGGYHMS
ncbi:acetoacetyl-CoA reductase [Cupriavidus pauculus]|uniref:acetoacetyl-CoA reductase n=1 Tax=Cupriavidus pauculus TaxID=82633 RepID=UPI0009FE833D|nr:acetoacetyl-CoA reductase [Cupriavidus pauculus]